MFIPMFYRYLHSIMVIAKIKDLPRSFFYDIPRYVKWTLCYELSFWHTVEQIRGFEIQNHVNVLSRS